MKFLSIILATLTLLLTGTTYGAAITLNRSNHVLLRNEVNDSTMAKLTQELNTLVTKRGNKTYPIYLVLDSPGGSIDSGLSFIEYAKTVPNLQTITIFSASMAAFITQSLPGDRNIIESGVLMFHRARGGVEGQFESGELESRLDLYKRLVRSMEVKSAQRMSMSLTDYKSAVKDELWILGSEAVSKKAADKQVDIVCASELLNSTTTETFLIFGMFQVKVKFNNCPLIRNGTVDDSAKATMYARYRSEKYGLGKGTK